MDSASPTKLTKFERDLYRMLLFKKNMILSGTVKLDTSSVLLLLYILPIDLYMLFVPIRVLRDFQMNEYVKVSPETGIKKNTGLVCNKLYEIKMTHALSA